MIYLLFPLYGGDPIYEYCYIVEECTKHESLEAAKQHAIDTYGPDISEFTEEDGYPPVDPSRWKQTSPRHWMLVLSEDDGFDETLYGFEIIIPADK